MPGAISPRTSCSFLFLLTDSGSTGLGGTTGGGGGAGISGSVLTGTGGAGTTADGAEGADFVWASDSA